MGIKLYALLLEDIRKDAELLEEMLTDEGFDIQMDVVETEHDYVSHLKRHNYDVIFADFTLPNFTGDKALDLAKEICPVVPFICISGTIGEDRAVELLKQGATDYVLKDRMERVAFATKRALQAAEHLKKFRQSEIELQTNRKLLQTVINNALDAIFIKDMNGRYLLFNDAAEKAMGKTSEEVIGKDDTFIFSASEAQMIMASDKIVIDSGVPITYEEPLTLADGHVHIFQTAKCPMFNDTGKTTGLFSIARDITERKQMELNLSKAKEKAEESDRLKTAFLHNISHEIRTPMNAIIGFSRFLNDTGLVPEKRKHFTEIIIHSCDQLLSIITDIVSISTIEAGQEKVHETEVKLNATLEFIHEQFSLKAKWQNVSLSLKPYLQPIEQIIITDETKLIQILTNLLNNALKFTPQGHVNFGYNIVDTENDSSYIQFFVEDTGIGIPPEMNNEIFKRFRQVETTITRNYGGSGLGLSISKAYVELLGGKIWFNSQLEKGSTFYFTIPYKKASLEHLSKTKSGESNLTMGQAKTILIAEDEESNKMVLEEMLADLNVKVIWATNGQEAIEICRSNKEIDLVLMDIKMPLMDGYEATKQIKEFVPGLQIIAQTAYTSDGDIDKAFANGFTDFISKPLDQEVLVTKIKELLYKK